MKRIKDVLRLKIEVGLSLRDIAKCTQLGPATVSEILSRFKLSGLPWPLPEKLDDKALEAKLYQGKTTNRGKRLPDFTVLHQELKRTGMTKLLLWEEYCQQEPVTAYRYTQFCEHYQRWLKKQKRSMRQLHKAGDKLFIDFCGPTVPIINPDNHLDYRAERGLKKTQVAELLSGQYLHHAHNILITGATGCGKTYLSCALAEQACQQHHNTRYYRLGQLLDELTLSHADGSYRQKLAQLAKCKLLLLDDWGMEKLNARQANDLLDIMEDRYQRGSTIIASQLPVNDWYKLISNPTVADALLDRLLHNSHRIELQGESMRKLDQSDHLS